MDNHNVIIEQITNSIKVKQSLLENHQILESINFISNKITDCLKRGNKILIAGNGGSAADAQHIAGELVNRFNFDRPALAGIALTTDTSVLTAIGNDSAFKYIFSRQLEAIGVSGDVFWGISTSGNSENILEACKTARGKNIFSFGLTGESGTKLSDICDISICVPSSKTPRIQ